MSHLSQQAKEHEFVCITSALWRGRAYSPPRVWIYAVGEYFPWPTSEKSKDTLDTSTESQLYLEICSAWI